MERTKSRQLFARAQKTIPGGVNSPVRTFSGVGGSPTFIKSARGSILSDVDGNQYVDYLGSWGPMIFGHAWQPVVEAVQKQLEKSSSFGLATEKEIELAELITSMVPGIEKVRLVNSGTEACMTAVRIARAATGREKIIKFNGCYHGHADAFLVKAGSGALTLGNPSSPGVPVDTVKNTLVAEFNDIESVKQIFNLYSGEIATIIIEPVAGNMGCIPPNSGFLQSLRELATRHGALLIFDEVMTGFRLAAGGAQELYGVPADLVTFGKIIGGGFPVGAVAGPNSFMNMLAPAGPVYQAGTLSGNPVATTAGITILSELKQNSEVYIQLEEKGQQLEKGLVGAFSKYDVPVQINRVGSMISVFFSDKKIRTFSDAANSDMELFSDFFHEMLNSGVHLPPSGYEAWFLGTTLSNELIEKTISAAEQALSKIKIKT